MVWAKISARANAAQMSPISLQAMMGIILGGRSTFLSAAWKKGMNSLELQTAIAAPTATPYTIKAAYSTTTWTTTWGREMPNCKKAQYGDCDGATVPVGVRPAGASPYGVLDMAGNVWEWVADWYDPVHYEASPAYNPQGPDSGLRKVFRGGSWGYPPSFLRTGERARNRPTYAGFNVGFRCGGVTADPQPRPRPPPCP